MNRILNYVKSDLSKFADKLHTFQEDICAAAVNVDLRKVFNPPCYDQGQLGSCTANSCVFLVEFQLFRETAKEFMGSRLFVYYNERLIEGDVGQDNGAVVADSINSIAKYGVCPETELPYDISQFAVKPSDACYTCGSEYKCDKFRCVKQTFNQLIQALAKGHPVTFGTTLYTSFENVGSDGLVPLPDVTKESVIGGHCMNICGWNGERFIVRNSWGPNWGDHGYCYFPKEYILNSDLTSDFWIVLDMEHPATL